MLKVGLTGGIGSGKSEVAKLLAGHGAVVIDADVLAREVVEPGTDGLAAVVEAFGPEILRPDGSLDRERLGSLVFKDATLLRRLESIVHPLVGKRTAELLAAAPDDAVVVYDVPLLIEKALAGAYDVVVVVDAPEDVRLERLEATRAMSQDDARDRMAAQASREGRLAAADEVVDNSGTLAELRARVHELWARLTARTVSA